MFKSMFIESDNYNKTQQLLKKLKTKSYKDFMIKSMELNYKSSVFTEKGFAFTTNFQSACDFRNYKTDRQKISMIDIRDKRVVLSQYGSIPTIKIAPNIEALPRILHDIKIFTKIFNLLNIENVESYTRVHKEIFTEVAELSK